MLFQQTCVWLSLRVTALTQVGLESENLFPFDLVLHALRYVRDDPGYDNHQEEYGMLTREEWIHIIT